MIKASAAEELFGEILRRMVESGSSDLHLKTALPPVVRLNDELRVLSRKYQPLSLSDLEGIVQAILPKHLKTLYQNGHEVDLAYSIAGIGRFRLNVYRYRGNIGITVRHIPLVIRSLDSLGLPSVVQKLAVQPRGLLLVTGITGSGKSTTVAACLNEWNQLRSGHIVTIEDPIEYVLADKKSIITQREVGIDTESFSIGLKNALRQDPDVIMIGELRDKQTIQTALAAAETGHLVISTLHTKDAVETVNRIIGVFEPEAQHEVRIQFSSCLSAIVSQRLLPKDPRKNQAGVVVAAEVLVNTPFVKSCLVDSSKTEQLRQAMEQGLDLYGMQTFDQSLMQLFRQGLITREVAVENATSPSDFDLRLRGIRSQDEGKWESLDKRPKPAPPSAPSQSPYRGQGAPSSGPPRAPGSSTIQKDESNTILDLPGSTLELDHPFRKDKK